VSALASLATIACNLDQIVGTGANTTPVALPPLTLAPVSPTEAAHSSSSTAPLISTSTSTIPGTSWADVIAAAENKTKLSSPLVRHTCLTCFDFTDELTCAWQSSDPLYISSTVLAALLMFLLVPVLLRRLLLASLQPLHLLSLLQPPVRSLFLQ
jgi:hypothetical protein